MNALIDLELLTEIQNKLFSEQQRLESLLAKTHSHINRDEPISPDFAEQAVEVENDEVVNALDQGAQIELSQINKAIGRIKSGHYGECVVCGETINEQRLKAIPHTPFCINCASAK